MTGADELAAVRVRWAQRWTPIRPPRCIELGTSSPFERNSAVSTVEIKTKRLGFHTVTHNKRFSVVEYLLDHGSRRDVLVLRESFDVDLDDSTGYPSGMVTVEALGDKDRRWSFKEPGDRGDVITNDLYRVRKLGCCGSPNIYSYYSLKDGRKVRVSDYELSTEEIVKLDGTIADVLARP